MDRPRDGQGPSRTGRKAQSANFPHLSGGTSMTKRLRALGGGALLLCATAACGGEGAFDAWCNAPGREVALLLYAAVFGGVGAIVVGWMRMRGLKCWDLRHSAGAPSTWTVVWVFLAIFLVSGLVLSFRLDGAEGCAPEQRGMNTWFLWGGILGGAGLCLAGWVVANKAYMGRR